MLLQQVGWLCAYLYCTGVRYCRHYSGLAAGTDGLMHAYCASSCAHMPLHHAMCEEAFCTWLCPWLLTPSLSCTLLGTDP